MKRALVVLLASFGLACSGELTELFVVVDSDLAVPSELDAVRVTTQSMSAGGALTNENPLPRTVGIVHRGGESYGPIVITVTGAQDGVEVVRARVTTAFVPGRTLVLPIVLERRCIAQPDACVYEVDPYTLDPWNGSVPRIDASAPGPTDGGTCTPTAEQCNGEDDDCDGTIDEGFDLLSDPENCGACNMVCELPNASAACVSGECAVDACAPGRADCDGDWTNGCETNVDQDDDHCGACGNRCRRRERCRSGVCR